MKCFQHHERDAVGLCYACQKGVCPECHVTVADTSSCHGLCEERVKDTIAMVQRNVEVSKSYSSGKIGDENLDIYRNQQKKAGTWVVVIGAITIFLVYKFAASLAGSEPQIQYIWLLALAGLFLYGAISTFLGYRRLARNREAVQSIWRAR